MESNSRGLTKMRTLFAGHTHVVKFDQRGSSHEWISEVLEIPQLW